MKKTDYDRCKPYLKKLFENDEKALSCPKIAPKLKISYGKVVEFYSIYIRERQDERRKKIMKIKAVFKMPDGRLETYDGDNQLMPDLSGKFSEALEKRIQNAANEKTKWSGF